MELQGGLGKNRMKKLLITCCLIIACVAFSQTYVVVQTGTGIAPNTTSPVSLGMTGKLAIPATAAGTTNQCFTINVAYYNIATNAKAGSRCSGSATFSITPSVTVAASFGIVVLMNDGTYYTNNDSVDPVTGVTGTFTRTVTFDFADTNAIIFPTNFSAAGPTVSVSASHINFH